MPKVSTRALKVLAAGLAGATVLGIAAVPAYAAAQAHKPVPLTANQLAKKANADFKSASSVYFYSKVTEHGLTITGTEQVARQGCLFTASSSGGFWVQNLIVGASEWVRLSNQTWQALGYTGTDLGYLEGKWVTLAAYLRLFGLSDVPAGRPDCHAHQASGLPSAGWTLGKKMVKVSGHWAWQISHRLTKHQSLTADVSDTRTPEYVAIKGLGSTEYLSRYNARVTLAAPPAADVITSLPPLPQGTIPAAGRLVRADRLITADRLVAGPGLVPGFALAVSK
jgi:hypothetical protein